MKVVSRSVGCLRKIDFADALFRTKGVVPQTSVTFEDPGALGIACVSYHGPVHTFKPANQTYHGIGYRVSGAQTIRIDKPRSFPHGTGRSGMTAIVPATEESAFHIDESIARYAMVFQQRLRDPEPVTELELNAIAHLLSAHLLRRYSNLARRPMSRVDQKLSSAELRTVTDYIEAHLDSALRLSELAAAIGMNQYRFARAFQATTGDSPHKYVMKLRITHAQDLLAASKLSLGTIAATVGFSSQSHMTLAFQRNLSITPGRYRIQTGKFDRDECSGAF